MKILVILTFYESAKMSDRTLFVLGTGYKSHGGGDTLTDPRARGIDVILQ